MIGCFHIWNGSKATTTIAQFAYNKSLLLSFLAFSGGNAVSAKHLLFRDLVMAYEKRLSDAAAEPRRNKSVLHVGTIILSSFIGLLLLLDYFHTIEMLGKQGLSVVLLSGFLNLSKNVHAQDCVPEIIRSSPPTNDQLEVALSTYSYCGGTLDVKVMRKSLNDLRIC